jgi:hypothetical protein
VSAAARIAAHGLPGAPALDDPPMIDAAWQALLQDACRQRITGHLVDAIDAGVLPASEHQCADAAAAHRDALALDLVLDRLLVQTSTRLQCEGIDHRALKGAALAYGVYPKPELRSYGDIDVLVDGNRYDDAIASLRGDGGRARYAEPRAGFTSRFGKGVCVVTADDLEVDVHRTFVAGAFGLALDVHDLFDAPVTIDLAGHSVPALAPVPRFLHACFHAALGDRVPRLVPLRDVAQIMLTTDLDVAAVLERAEHWRARVVVQHAVRATWRMLHLSSTHELVSWARHYTPDRFERTALRAYVAPDRSYATQAAAGVLALRTARDRAAYARALLLPERDYAKARGGYFARLKRSARAASRWKESA